MSKNNHEIIHDMRVRTRELLEFLQSEEPADQEHIEWMKACLQRTLDDIMRLQEPY